MQARCAAAIDQMQQEETRWPLYVRGPNSIVVALTEQLACGCTLSASRAKAAVYDLCGSPSRGVPHK